MPVKVRTPRLKPTDKNDIVSADLTEGHLVLQRADGSQIDYSPEPSEGGGGASRTKIFELKSSTELSPGDITEETAGDGFLLPIGEPSEMTFTNDTYHFLEFEFFTQGWTVFAEGGAAELHLLLEAYTTMDDAEITQLYAWLIEIHPEYVTPFPNVAALKTALGWPAPWVLPLGSSRVAMVGDGESHMISAMFKPAQVLRLGETVMSCKLVQRGTVDPATVLNLNALHASSLEVYGSDIGYGV